MSAIQVCIRKQTVIFHYESKGGNVCCKTYKKSALKNIYITQ